MRVNQKSYSKLRKKKIAILGLGYVGLPLALEFGKKFETLGFDISNESIVIKIAEDAGLSAIEFKNYIELQSTKDSLIRNSSELIERGGFGSPTFFYNNHMFFGNDRLHLLEEAISKELI